MQQQWSFKIELCKERLSSDIGHIPARIYNLSSFKEDSVLQIGIAGGLESVVRTSETDLEILLKYVFFLLVYIRPDNLHRLPQ